MAWLSVRSPVLLFAIAALLVGVGAATLTPVSDAVHFYRGPGGDCTPAQGALGDDTPSTGPGAVVLMSHNTFHDTDAGVAVTVINQGESVTWVWNSEHCHSIQSTQGAFYSGFHYPAPEPTTPALLPGLFHYPVPTLEPTLSYTHTFDEAGIYPYICEHHGAIGMAGIVVVV